MIKFSNKFFYKVCTYFLFKLILNETLTKKKLFQIMTSIYVNKERHVWMGTCSIILPVQ